jgi:uncharacterized protein
VLSPDSVATKIVLAVVLAVLIVGLVVNAIIKDRSSYRRFVLLTDSVARRRTMRRWLVQSFVIFGGSAVVSLALAWQFVPSFLAGVNGWSFIASARSTFSRDSSLSWGILIGVLVALVGGGIAAIFAARNNEEIASIGDIQALLPRNRAELPWGAALSVNAGVVEELLFRLAIPAMIFGITNNVLAAVIGSIAVFGLLHAYQGLPGVIGAVVMGTILMAVYIASGSIVVAMLVHAAIDLRSLVLIPLIVMKVQRVTSDQG